MTSLNEIRALLNRRLQVRKSSQFLTTYLESASGRLHDAILAKKCNAFFSELEDENILSPRSRYTATPRQDFASRLGNLEDYYDSTLYNVT